MMQIADVIRIGRYRMVRMPPNLDFEADQVEVYKIGPFLLLRPLFTSPDSPIAAASARPESVEASRECVGPIPAYRRDAANDRYLARGHLRLAA